MSPDLQLPQQRQRWRQHARLLELQYFGNLTTAPSIAASQMSSTARLVTDTRPGRINDYYEFRKAPTPASLMPRRFSSPAGQRSDLGRSPAVAHQSQSGGHGRRRLADSVELADWNTAITAG
jgi:hypothetical protein